MALAKSSADRGGLTVETFALVRFVCFLRRFDGTSAALRSVAAHEYPIVQGYVITGYQIHAEYHVILTRGKGEQHGVHG